jgi:biotin operon repressor
MFGNKKAKQKRLNDLTQLIQTHGPVSQAELARQLGVKRSTIHKDVQALAKRGLRIAEDRKGWLELPQNED